MKVLISTTLIIVNNIYLLFLYQPGATILQPDCIRVSLPNFVPVQDIVAPLKITGVLLTITIARCLLQSGESTGKATHNIMIPYNETEIRAQSLDFDIPMARGMLVITGARLQYFMNGNSFLNLSKDGVWQPAAVIDARFI